jgi:enoyl-[acyl-carrier protein] reductase II
VRKAVSIPLIAAGGIGSGEGMLAVEALGAEAVQIGSRFVCTTESSAHQAFKDAVIRAGEGDTKLMMKKLTPVRLLKNEFYRQLEAAENAGAGTEELQELLGRARAKRGMFEGMLDEGELEIGQISASIRKIVPAAEVVNELMESYRAAKARICRSIG